MTEALLSVRELRRPGLEPVSFTLAARETIHISGPSGAGKTLLLRAVADLDPNEGDLRLEGVPRWSLSPPSWRRQVRYLAAEPGWWADGVAAHFAAPDRARELAAAVGLSPELLDGAVARLSTGERQRLALLRALENAPKVLLLDEPTAALDGHSSRRVADLLRRTLSRGAGLVVVAHDPCLREHLEGRAFTMRAGRLSRA